jgi:hypothetical protein
MFYHTSMDTIDNVSEDSLRRVGWIAAVSALTIADADERTAHQMASMVCSEGMRRISEAVAVAVDALYSAKGEPIGAAEFDRLSGNHAKRLEHIIRREALAVHSVCRLLAEDAEPDDFIEAQMAAVEEHGSRELVRLENTIDAASGRQSKQRRVSKRLSKAEEEAMAIIPRRRFKGTIDSDTMSEKLGEKRYGWYSEVEDKDSNFSRKMYEMVNLMDGKRTAYDIAEFVSAEYGLTDLKNVLRFLADLKTIGYVQY